MEKPRFARKGKSHWSTKNDVLNAWPMSVVLLGALIAVFGIGILPFLVIQAIVGFSLLEVVNYLEHYGMLRQRTGPDKYRPLRAGPPSHSWNSNNIATNVLLYHLQRHCDHHANPTRRYQTLRHFEESPELPTGYAWLITSRSSRRCGGRSWTSGCSPTTTATSPWRTSTRPSGTRCCAGTAPAAPAPEAAA